MHRTYFNLITNYNDSMNRIIKADNNIWLVIKITGVNFHKMNNDKGFNFSIRFSVNLLSMILINYLNK